MPGSVGRIPTPSAAPSGLTLRLSDQAWSATPLGPRQLWDPALRTVVDLVLDSPVAMALTCGDDLVLVYNDRCAELLGARHPAAFGQPAPQVFGDLWQTPGIGDVIERVYRTGEPFLERAASLPHARSGIARPDQAVFVRGHWAVRDASGYIIGVLTIAAESTQMTRQLQSLGELASALSGTLTLDDVARVALRFAATSFAADLVAFGIDDGPDWRTVRRVPGDLLDEVDERLPPLWHRSPVDSPTPLAATARSGVPLFVSEGQPLLATATDRHDERIRALAALPLNTPSLRGALTLGYRDPYPWLPTERALLTAWAELVAQAAERARKFEKQHGTAQLLQRSMLPEHLPDLPRLRIAARYAPGVDGNATGGDFYDAFALPGGQLAVVLGDVAGHDVRAAALMGQVRAALRALALSDPDPACVLRGLDRLVASLGAEAHSDELFVTVLYGVVDPEAGRLTLASAGHPAPLLRRAVAGGPTMAEYLDLPPGVPLGLGGRRVTHTMEFRAGDTLLLFSDGVVERRNQDLSDGLDQLAVTIAAASGGAPRTLCAAASSAVPGTTEDDVAVLAVENALTPSRSAAMAVPAEPTAPGRVRRWLTAQLTAWQVAESVIGSAVLCASELTTNALLHAGTAARVEIDLSPERLLVSVADSGTRGIVARAHTDPLSSRGRGLGLIEQLSDAWGTDPTVRGSTVWFEMLIPAGQRR
ncbi:hypothetical protein GCM10027290_13830 [Micromonospora sonneratiae]|uniref:SpoIIE family protein phosphatase n=1 Tax=Micromonospora sonneratiae TaxID=1184706 RepID=A0ABW3YL08_9ACTN